MCHFFDSDDTTRARVFERATRGILAAVALADRRHEPARTRA